MRGPFVRPTQSFKEVFLAGFDESRTTVFAWYELFSYNIIILGRWQNSVGNARDNKFTVKNFQVKKKIIVISGFLKIFMGIIDPMSS